MQNFPSKFLFSIDFRMPEISIHALCEYWVFTQLYLSMLFGFTYLIYHTVVINSTFVLFGCKFINAAINSGFVTLFKESFDRAVIINTKNPDHQVTSWETLKIKFLHILNLKHDGSLRQGFSFNIGFKFRFRFNIR